MGSASDYLEKELLDHVLKVGAFTQPSNLYVALFTTIPGDDDSGVEVSGGSYVRVSFEDWSASAKRESTNNAEIAFATPTASWGTVVAAGLYDALMPIPQSGTEMDRGRTGGDWGEIVKPKETDLLYLLESGDLDYAFEYRSIAIQHGFDFVELPDEIDLSSIDFTDFYATATVEVTGSEPGSTATQTGAAIVYGVTIPGNAAHPERAVDFLELMLGAEGRAIIESCGQSPIVPAIASDRDKIPRGLRGFVAE